jgi:FKBP-type peptidyl-prolyl cis-trans isomerase SlpA
VRVPIEVASSVTLHLSLTLEDGTVAESTSGEEPLTFTMGDGTLVHGLELGLYGLVPGAVQRLELHPEQAFGLRDPANIHAVPRADFDPAMTLEPGVIVGFETADGDELAGAILLVSDETVEVDFNHPMAGHTIIFDVEIIDVVPANAGD